MVERSRRTGGAGASRGTGRSAFIRGAAGMERTDTEIERAKQRAEERRKAGSMPFRFYVPVGETRQLIVCDDKPDFFMYEHGLKDSEGRWGRLFCGCIKEFDNCPACESTGKESYYAMVLTVVDLTPFTLRDGTKVEFSRKLLVVKPAQQKKFLRFYNKEGTLRGAIFDMTRDGDKDSSIGNDIEFVEWADEDEMASYHRSWKDKDGKKHSEECGEPYVYEELFEEPTAEGIRAIVGGEPTPGSREHTSRELGGRSGRSRRGGDDDAGTQRPRRGREAPADDDDWEQEAGDDDLPFDDQEQPRGGRGRMVRGGRDAEQERPARRGRGAPPPDADQDDDPPARGPARRGRAAPEPDDEPARPARRGRGVPPDDDQGSDQDDDPPARGPARRGRAAPDPEPEEQPRRAAVRRGRR